MADQKFSNYDDIPQDTFDNTVRDIARELGTDYILDIPGVWEEVSENLNNAVLDKLCPYPKS